MVRMLIGGELVKGSRALDVVVVLGHRQAAFLIGVQLLRDPGDLGVDDEQRRLLLALAGEVERDDALGDADLDRRQSDAGGVVHGLQHVVEDATDLVVHDGDRLGDELQAGVGQGDDVEFGHERQIGEAFGAVNRERRRTERNKT